MYKTEEPVKPLTGTVLQSSGHGFNVGNLDVQSLTTALESELEPSETCRIMPGSLRPLQAGVSRLLCKRPSFVFGDGVPGKGAVSLPRPISVEVGCSFIA